MKDEILIGDRDDGWFVISGASTPGKPDPVGLAVTGFAIPLAVITGVANARGASANGPAG